MEIYYQARRARDSVTGNPDQRQIADVLSRIERLPQPAHSLIRLALDLPTNGRPDLYKAGVRKALAALDKESVIRVLHGTEPIILRDPDLRPTANTILYGKLVDAIITHHDVHFTEAELLEVMKDACPRAKTQFEVLRKESMIAK